ncbi:MAG: glutathione synthase [Flavobacteriales bacterium]|nr:glutathione synthase [Flavobacteriales bacterium]MDG1780535.1 glutathione synthase [Flavobacteriales bacterium]MDG2245433.1 glutathione synthase [Flavobacteriales bacterium]
MNYLFIMYPWEDISPERDSTIRLIHECASRGYTVGITTAANLTIRDCLAQGFVKVLKKSEKLSKAASTFHKQAQFEDKMVPLAGFDVIFMRANPPLDTLVLNFLDSVKNDVFIINNVEGLREANNKVYTAAFYDPNNEIIPATHVSKNKAYLKKIIQESESKKMIMKPLNGYGGSGVIVLEKAARSNISSLLDFYIDGKNGDTNYVIIQDYVEGAELGDVRVLMLHGEPIGAMRRVPADGDARSNVSAGGTIQKHVLTKDEKRLCKKIGNKLVRDGLFFVGLDLIGGKLIEVNVLSPGGITYINKLNKVKLQIEIIDYCDDQVMLKNSATSRREEFRQALNNA